MLVGGGELHETFDSLVQPGAPAVARASSASPASPRGWSTARRRRQEVLPEIAELLEGRVLVAHNARFDTARAPPGVRARRARLARAARGLHGAAGPPLRAAGPQARARDAGRLAGHRGGRGAPGAPGRAHLRARVLRPVPAAVRQRGDDRRRAGPAPLAPAGAQDGARRGDPARPSARTSPRSRTTRASTSSATTAGGRSTWASRCPCARARGPTSARPPAGPSGPRSWTTGPPTPSSARSCWRTG